MTSGAWMCRQYDDGLKIWLAAPRENEKPFIDSERAQKWRLSLASLLFFTVLLSDHLWFCAEAKLTRTRDKEHHQQQQQQRQQQQQQRQQQQRQQQQQRPRQQEPSWPALLAGMGESAPAAQAHRLLSASASPTLPPSPGGGGGGKSGRGRSPRSKPLFLGNSAKPLWRLETCYPQGAPSGQCFTVDSADAVCARNWSRGAAAVGEEERRAGGQRASQLWNLSDFYLSFCNSYTLWELFSGLSSPNTLNCSLDVVLTEGGEMATCRQCVEAYQDYDHHAQEKYEEFESVLHKYLQSEEYSVKSCPEDCKIVYKAWLCSQYFEVTQFNCRKTIPCKQYCLEVQTRCPFILPDNDEVIYGGLSSFICTGEGEVYL
ncbi:PREDICTED: transmembrane protein FAM155A isoform X2 [Chinchilla lanigera]|uniref:NALCN channel auxiliary factor 1 n=1 Tax=Chinchilla lanigera TaxID=34839 RepID=A0A8C2UT19_CHILA|nr:PREDICTED: transmembrane protein FAM155A isoform X2 [Chinchilla lanigera]